MADEPQRGGSEAPTTKPEKEDAETTAARREFKHTTISDVGDKPAQPSQDSRDPSDDEAERTKTPEPEASKDAAHDDLKEQVSSPKKKRAHDQFEEHKDGEEASLTDKSAADKANGDATTSRTDRSEPQKKRARDETSGDESNADKPSEIVKDTAPAASSDQQAEKPKETPASSFSSSGFAKLASSTASPFGTIGGATKNVFGGGASSSGFGGFGGGSTPSPFAAAGPPKLSFGSGSGSASGASTGATSPFSGLNGAQSSGFGSVLGGGAGFGSMLSGPKLSSFAKPGEAFKSHKPAKPFGAPESDAEEDDEGDDDGEEGDDAEDAGENEDDKQKEKDDEPKAAADDKKKPKLQKVVVDDGEAGEVTLLQVRAKMFQMEKGVGWKERGAGMLKVNVPASSVEYNQNNIPVPETFDASVLDEEPMRDGSKGRKSVRLIMRQDHTHRVILNTVILPAMEFQLNQKLKASLVLFMAFEGQQVHQVQMKVSPAVCGADMTGLIRLRLSWGVVCTAHPFAPTPDAIKMSDQPQQVRSTPDSHLGKRKRNVKTPTPGVASRASTPSTAASTPAPDDAFQDETTTSRRTKAKKGKPAGVKRSETVINPVECVVEWPEYFKILEKTHRALNLVFTFCCTRKHLVTTFDTIRSAVEANTKRQLLVEDVAAIVSLRPDAIKFAYVDEVMLQIDVQGAEKEDTFKTGRFRGKSSQAFAPDASVGGFTGRQGLTHHPDEQLELSGKEVLYFEFVDEDLKRQVQSKKTGEATNPTRKLRDEDVKLPVYSQKQMTALIEKRNVKFANAMSEFVNRCVEEGIDPELALRSQAEGFIPRESSRETSPGVILSSTLPETIPKERKSIPEIVQELKDSPWYTGQIVPDGHRVFDEQEAVYGDLNFLLSQEMVNALYNAKGITQFFAHQAEAINALHDGHNVIVSTSTSSGKSLIYQLPVMHALEQDPNTRAMYIFPTKALAQDQKRSLKEMLGYLPGLEEVMVETFDGDTPFQERNTIRDEARIIFTNPDMLHITILPQEERWRTFLKNLKYVVVDEIHYYNGLMGSHVAFIMRRLRRICAAVGNRHVKFISCSATVANPEEHFKTIFGLENVKLVDFDGSPSGRKEFLCWNTPFKDPGDPSSGRGNAMYECARLFCQLILRGVRVIAFTRVREQCEKLVGAIKQELEGLGRLECIARVMGYRGGYTAQDRRGIERDMFEGKLLGIVATTALELGVDIGTLDCVLTWGFPYTISNLRQQSGRAGRRNKDSLSILVGDGFATDQHYMQNPDELFTKPNCELQVDLENMLVREGHIQCAAYEMPIRPVEDAKYFGADLQKLCEERLIKDDLGFYHCHDRFRPQPSKFVSIRDTEEDHFAIIDITNNRNVVLEELEASRATFTIYDGAIFLHQGVTYLVRDFNPDKGMARVEKVKVDWTTEQRDYTDIDPVETEAIKRIPGSLSSAYHGAIRITQVVFGYFKVDRRNRILDAVAVDNPPVVRHSKGMWLDVPKRALDILVGRRLHVAGGIHAAEHAVMSLMPNFVVSMPGDVRTECKSGLKEFAKRETRRKRPARLTFYDAKGGAGGSGINTKAFEFIDLLLRQALDRVVVCGCETGCVECVCSELCKESNEVMSKAGGEVILRALLGEEIDVESLPMGPEEFSPAGIETVVLAEPVRPRDRGLLRVEGLVKEEVEEGLTIDQVPEAGPQDEG
ncbi:hypothetical protein GE09DRAFT_956103 [Coniochaeta sp. 2T2.1]|nr:hypothetical protein GE09DRAFT_956103 [Coniochaeta sp. 2T2.1]